MNNKIIKNNFIKDNKNGDFQLKYQVLIKLKRTPKIKIFSYYFQIWP